MKDIREDTFCGGVLCKYRCVREFVPENQQVLEIPVDGRALLRWSLQVGHERNQYEKTGDSLIVEWI